MATPSNLGPSASSTRSNWFTRNWKWAVPVGLLVVFLLFASFVGGILLLVETSFQHSDSYTQALARARADPRVAGKIGRPLKAGWLASGSINTSNSSGDADFSIPISGPRAKGTLHVVAKKIDGLWTFKTLQVEVEGDAERIDLLLPEENGFGGS
jgi:cytochrome oxidase complex assembly protein 1